MEDNVNRPTRKTAALSPEEASFLGSKSALTFGHDYTSFEQLSDNYVFHCVESPANIPKCPLSDNFLAQLAEKSGFRNVTYPTGVSPAWSVHPAEDAEDDGQKTIKYGLFACPLKSPESPALGLLTIYYPASKSLQVDTLYIGEDFFIDDFLTREAKLMLQLLFTQQDDQEKLGTILGGATLTELIRRLTTAGLAVDTVYLQLPNPVLLQGSKLAQLRAAEVLNVCGEAGAKWLKFDYWFPYSKKQSQRNVLLTFPLEQQITLPVGQIMAFLVDYVNIVEEITPLTTYEALQLKLTALAQAATSAELLADIRTEIATNQRLSAIFSALLQVSSEEDQLAIRLREPPRLETPRLKFKRASICLEIMVDEDYFEPVGFGPAHDLTPKQGELTLFGRLIDWVSTYVLGTTPEVAPLALYCPVTHSAETALFSYQHQSNPPYFTKQYLPLPQRLTAYLPSVFEFPTEGRLETTYVLPTQDGYMNATSETLEKESFPGFIYPLGLEAHLSYSYFLKSSVRVWHLVFTPQESGITEFELIKFIKFFTGNQESESEDVKRQYLNQIQFELPQENEVYSGSSVASSPDEKLSERIGSHLGRYKWVYLLLFLLLIWYINSESIAGASWGYWLPFWLLLIVASGKVIRSTIAMILKISHGALQLVKRTFYPLLYKKQETDYASHKIDPVIKLLQDLTSITYKARPSRKNDDSVLSKDKFLSLRNVRSGILEIDTGAENENDFFVTLHQDYINRQKPYVKSPAVNGQLIFNLQIKEFYKSIYRKDPNLLSSLVKAVTAINTKENTSESRNDLDDLSDSMANYILALYCGICMGIIDYTRMGQQELDDVITPFDNSKTISSFITINRGGLMMFAHKDDVLNAFWETLGVNAYLLIPNAVLAHNDSVSIDADNRLDEILGRLRYSDPKMSISYLLGKRNEIDDLLNDNVLSNVFHYKTEQEIFSRGMQSRGIDERIARAKDKLSQLDKMIEVRQEERTASFQRRIQFLALLAGTISIYTVIKDFIVKELVDGSEEVDQVIDIDHVRHLNDERINNAPSAAAPFLEWIDSSWDWIVTHFFNKDALKTTHNLYSLVIAFVLIYAIYQALTDPSRLTFRNKIFRKSRRFIPPKIRSSKKLT